MSRLLCAPLLLLLVAGAAGAGEEALTIKSFDGYGLDARLATPEGGADKLIVLIHGSGPNDMDENLSRATRGGKQKILFFKELSDRLVARGFGVLRYNKRSFQFGLSFKKDPEFRSKPAVKGFTANPLKYFVDDAGAMVGYLRARFPRASVYLLGHSQGCYIGLQLAHADPKIKGVALIGFAMSTLDTLVHEQVIHRPVRLFRKADTNGDERLDARELAADTKLTRTLRAQMAIVDLNGDKVLSFDELRAANMSNLLVRDMIGQAYRQQEARYPRIATILKTLQAKVAWFQGEWDNQTPAYQARSVQLVNRAMWRKPNFSFTFFPKLGHALDPRASYDELFYQVPDPRALDKVADTLKKFF